MEPIWSTGGTGGEHAVLADLDFAVHALRGAAADVGDAADAVLRAGTAGHLAMRARGLEWDLLDVARRLLVVTDTYIGAERDARAALAGRNQIGESLADGLGVWLWVQRVAATALWKTTPLGGLGAVLGEDPVAESLFPDDAPPTSGGLNGESVQSLLKRADFEELVAGIAARLANFERRFGELPLQGASEVGVSCEVGPTSLEELMAEIKQTEEIGGGEVRISRWTGEDGIVRRVVFISGTQEWIGATANPSDAHANFVAVTGDLPDVALMVMSAIEADGAKPGEPILVGGHSQGGIIATALAASPAVAKRFTIKAVVTAGAPTGRIALPSSVSALHLEGTRDIVPGLDGMPNPDTPSRVTVHHDARRSKDPALAGAGRSIASAHSLDTYKETARLVDNGLNSSTDAWLDANSEFFAPTGSTVTRYRPS